MDRPFGRHMEWLEQSAEGRPLKPGGLYSWVEEPLAPLLHMLCGIYLF